MNPAAYNEKELLLSVAGGNESAFSQLFHYWYPPLLAYIFKITRSQQVAEEIVQDIFTKIWLNRNDLLTINNFKSYLFVMSRNHALNELQKISVYWKVQLAFAKEQPVDNMSAEATSLVENALEELSPRQREIWLLSRRHRYTYEEISLQLGISRETVKTHLRAATESLMELLKHKSLILFFLAFS